MTETANSQQPTADSQELTADSPLSTASSTEQREKVDPTGTAELTFTTTAETAEALELDLTLQELPDESPVLAGVTEETSTLPLIPDGVVAESRPEPVFAEEAVSASPEEVSALRFLGESVESGEDYVASIEPLGTFGEVMIQVVDACLESDGGTGEEMTGETLAQIFCRGDIEDERVAFLLLLLAQNQPITSELILSAARAQGYEELVEQAIVSREELERAGDVSVEQLDALTGGFSVPLAPELVPSAQVTP